MKTLAEVATAHDFAVLGHLEHDAHVPVNDGIQAQGDVLIIPLADAWPGETPIRTKHPIGAEGVAVVEATGGGGHEHRLFAGTAGTATWAPLNDGQDAGVLQCYAAAYLLHPEHGATGIAPGEYVLRRQREQADQERLVAD